MTDYTELVNNLRLTERVCRDRMDGQVMLDAAAAIEELLEAVGMLGEQRSYWIDKAAEYYNQLPKLGEWIIVDEWKNTLGDKLMKIKCPFCNKQIKLYEQPMPKYCDSCGARMEVQDGQK